MFYENAQGYNFKSIDSMIEDINNQKDSPTNEQIKRKCIDIHMHPKTLNEELDNLTLEGISFPEEGQKLLLKKWNNRWL